MEQAVITSALTAQRAMFRQQRAYDGFVNFITTFAGRNRATRRHPEKASAEVLVGGSLLIQSLVAGLDTTALKAWQNAQKRLDAHWFEQLAAIFGVNPGHVVSDQSTGGAK